MIDHRRVCYALRCPSRAVFLAVMSALHHPATGQPLAVEGDDGVVTADNVIIDEIGPVVIAPPELDDEGEQIAPAILAEGHHVNMYATGDLAGQLMADPVSSLRAMLGTTEFAAGETHDFDGYVGASGIKVNLMSVTDAAGETAWTGVITTPARVMA